MRSFQRIFSAFSVNIGSLVVRAVIGVILSAFLARSFNPNDFGLLAFFIVVAQFAGNLSELGVRTSLVTLATPLRKRKDPGLFGLLFYGLKLRIKMSLLLMIAGTLIVGLMDIGGLYDSESIRLLLYGMVIGILGTTVNFPLAIHRIYERFNRYSFIQTSLPLLRLSLIWIVVLIFGADITLVMVIFFVSLAVYSVIVCWDLPWNKILSSEIPKSDIARKFINLNGWLGAAYIIEALAVKLDVFMIKGYLDNSELAIYYAAYQFVSLLFLLGSGFTFVLLPKLTHDKFQNSKPRITPFIFSSALLLTGVSSSFIFTFSPELILFIFGDQYAESVNILNILVFAGFFGLLQAGSGQLILRYYSSYHLIGIAFVNLAVNFLLNVIFIPMFGLYGAAISTVIAYMIICIYSWGVCFWGASRDEQGAMSFSLVGVSVIAVSLLFMPSLSMMGFNINFTLFEKLIIYAMFAFIAIYVLPVYKSYIKSFNALVRL